MGSDWKSGKLGDYVSSCLGKMLDKKKNKGDYQPYLGNSNVRWGYFELDNLSEMKFEPHELNRYSLKKGDLIVCEGGEPGRCAIWEEDVPTMMIQKALHRIRPFNELDSKYLFYWFLNAGRAGRLDPFFTGTTIKHLTGKALSQLPIDIPPMEHQRYSVNILSSLDDKIQLNKKTNQTLEQMAQALFKSWFVDFDPVFDNLLASADFKLENLETSLPDELKQKAQRRLAALDSLENAAEVKASLSALAHELQALLPTKAAEQAAETPVKANFNANPNILAQHANTHSHFPNEFEHNEQLGWIPKGWEVESIYESIDIVYGAPFKSKQFNNDAIGHPIIRIRDLKTGSPQNWSDELHPKRTLIKAGDIVVGMDAEFRATVWSGEDGFLNQRLFLAKGRKKYISNLFIKYSLAPLLAFQEHTQVGTTVAHLGKKEIDRFEILMPSNSILKQSSDFFEDIKDKIVQNYKSTTQLTKLRDTLLPKLISGELQIPDLANISDTNT